MSVWSYCNTAQYAFKLKISNQWVLLLLLIEYFFNRYDSSFHVQEYGINSAAEIKILIKASLMAKYENASIIIETLNVGIKHLGKTAFLTKKYVYTVEINLVKMLTFFF